ncbi:hypothetical protein Tco_0642731 [Tanacetum coccineum]
MKAIFNPMETEVEQCSMDRKCVEIEKKELLIENEHLLEQIISQDIMCSAMPSYDDLVKYVEMEESYIDEYNGCVKLNVELSKTKDMVEKVAYNELSNRSKSGKSKKKNEWKPTGKVFTNVGHRWLPIGRTFTIDGSKCPLTRISSTQMVPPKKPGQTKANKNATISRVYYVEGLGHNLFLVGQFYDSNLEVALRKHTCFVRDLEGVDLLTGSRGTNLYTLSLEDMMKSSPICLLSKASMTKSWLCDDLGKLKLKDDIGIFFGYSPAKKAYQIYNKWTRLIMETIHVEFDELTPMASEQFCSGLELQLLTPGSISSGLVQNPSSSKPYVSLTKEIMGYFTSTHVR